MAFVGTAAAVFCDALLESGFSKQGSVILRKAIHIFVATGCKKAGLQWLRKYAFSLESQAQKLPFDLRCECCLIGIAPKPIVNIMVKVHAPRQSGISNMVSRFFPSRENTELKYCNVSSTNDLLHQFRCMRVETLLEFPKRVRARPPVQGKR